MSNCSGYNPMHKPLISITLAYIAGLLLGQGFLYFPYSISLIFLLGILTVGLSIRFGRLAPNRFFLFTLPALLGFAAFIFSSTWLPADHYTRTFQPDKLPHTITGMIASSLDRDPDRTGFVLNVGTIDDRRVSGKIRVSVRDAPSSLGYNDHIRVSGKLFEPRGYHNPGGFDYAAYLAQSGIYFTTSVTKAGNMKILKRGTGVFRMIQDWRERIRQAFLASTTGPGSAILQAMVLGEEGGLNEELRDRFMAAGVTHIISISGSHLGMVAVLCFGFIRCFLFLLPERFYHRLTLVTDPKKVAAWLTLPLVIFYTLLAGGQAATIRSLIMIAAGLCAVILDRENALMHSLALAALIILALSPQAIFDISFQLSYLSVFVIGAVVMLWNDLGIRTEHVTKKFRNNVLLLSVISLATSLATGPLVARYFNQISFAGIISNMIVVPFAGMVVVPLGLFSGILSLFLNHLPLAGINQAVADAFIAVVAFFSGLPFAEFHPTAPTVLWLLFAAIFLYALFTLIRIRLLFAFNPLENTRRFPNVALMGTVVIGLCLALSAAVGFTHRDQTTVLFPDVGQGDCALLELKSGKRILIDGGGVRDNRFDIGRRVLAPFLWNRGIRSLDLVILSHPHPDHMNGLLFIVKKFSVEEIWTHDFDKDATGYAEFLRIILEKKIKHRIVAAEDEPFMRGDAELRVVHPYNGFRHRTSKVFDAENNRSLVVRIAEGNRVFLFPGDIGAPAERALAQKRLDLKCDLLKVPHHGSKSSSTNAFVSLARPRIAVVTVGRGNQFHHPSDQVLSRYEQAGTRVFRTDTDGAVAIHSGTEGMDVLPWSALVLKRIDPAAETHWKELELNNWKRLWLRRWEI